MWLISEPSPGFFGTVQSLTAAHLLSGCWAVHHDVRLNAFGGTMFRKPSYKKLLLAFCCLCFAIQYIPKMLLLFVCPTFLFYIHCCLLSSLHFYMNAAKYFLVLIISYFRRNFCEPKKLFTKVQTMEFQFNQANQATALIRDHFVATFWEAVTKLLILTGTPRCGFCCHAAPFLHAKKWLNISISICIQSWALTVPSLQTLPRIYLDGDSEREIFLYPSILLQMVEQKQRKLRESSLSPCKSRI